MDRIMDDQRDYAEELYNARYCDACGASPCSWDGVTADGFHAEEADTPYWEAVHPLGSGSEGRWS